MIWLWLALAIIAGLLAVCFFFVATMPKKAETYLIRLRPRRRIP